MKRILPILAAVGVISSFTACDDSTTVGSSLVKDNVEIVMDSAFTVTGHSVNNDRVQSRTITQLLGQIDAKGYGNLTSDVVTQFMPSNVLDTAGVTVETIDSLKLMLVINAGAIVGDSLAPMGLKVYPLNKQLPDTIYSDFNPSGYYDQANPLGARVYNAAGIGESDSLAALPYRYIYVDMPLSLGRKFYTEYLTNPNTFSGPDAFAKFFPGIYIANTYGSGRIMQITATEMRLFYHQTLPKDDDSGKDTTYIRVGTYFATTPEIVTNNNITFDLSSDIDNMIAQGKQVIVAPAGRDVEMTFPTTDILAKYRAQSGDFAVINTLSMEIPAEEITNNYSIKPPEYLLMVLSKDKQTFFNKNQIPDNKTSFYAQYNTTTKSYSFTGLRQYIMDMLNKEEVKPEDVTFTLTPVDVVMETSSSGYYYYESQSYLSEKAPSVSTPSMVTLNLDKAKIKFVFSKQTIKN
mgnify:CR=1 FL=1